MSQDAFDALAPFATALGTFAVGVFIQGVHPIIACIVAIAAGFAYDWLDRQLG
ncbi:hypothetical protein [Rhizobium leguminosarum]|uniref:hypothetical protein n=1 Tax=Rhizobium leguminosarum TaxID=384 RepID=UPI0004AF1708|nr:hypothetical protein [Rhizobium leguminosarum]